MPGSSDEEVVLVFVPALAGILAAKERQKGSPLTEPEVLAIRDAATSIAVPKSAQQGLVERRGYQDIDPENCWAEWRALSAKLSRPEAA